MEIVTLSMHLHALTPKAALLSDDGKEKNAKWLPLSQIELDTSVLDKVVEVQIPEWLAMKNDLI
jgi:hypothetical protein